MFRISGVFLWTTTIQAGVLAVPARLPEADVAGTVS